MKKNILLVLVVLVMIFSLFTIASCNVNAVCSESSGKSSSKPDASAGQSEIKFKSILSVNVNASGELILTFTDGTTANLGIVRGDKGAKGDKGENGENGRDGKSAYEIWLENGNSGSETDFLEWLKGQKGDKGDKGDNGSKGDRGNAGRGITSMKFNDKGELIVTYSDGTIQNLGVIKGSTKEPVFEAGKNIPGAFGDSFEMFIANKYQLTDEKAAIAVSVVMKKQRGDLNDKNNYEDDRYQKYEYSVNIKGKVSPLYKDKTIFVCLNFRPEYHVVRLNNNGEEGIVLENGEFSYSYNFISNAVLTEWIPYRVMIE